MADQLFPPASNWKAKQVNTTAPRAAADEYYVTDEEMFYQFMGDVGSNELVGYFQTTDGVDLSQYADFKVDLALGRTTTGEDITAIVESITENGNVHRGDYFTVSEDSIGTGSLAPRERSIRVDIPKLPNGGGALRVSLRSTYSRGRLYVYNVTAREVSRDLAVTGCRMKPNPANPGETVRLGIDVTNSRETWGSGDVVVTVGGTEKVRSTEKIDGNRTAYLIYEIEADEVGEYDVDAHIENIY